MIAWPSIAAARYRGFLEGVSDGRVHGWAFDTTAPEARLSVRLKGPHGSTRLTVADRYRADLFSAGIGDGHYGFSVPVAAFPALDGIRAFVDGMRNPLPGTARARTGQRRARRTDLGGLMLGVDARTSRRCLSGWAFEPGDPTRRICLALRHQGRIIARDVACRFRNDPVEEAGDALHGFRLVWTLPVAGRGLLIDETVDRVLARVSLRS